ncbi:MAG: hypothetical protein ACM3SR_06535 [Ignavibacteriales bacterium]
MSTIDRMLGKPQARLELRLQPKLMQLLKEESLKEGKSVNGIIRESLIDRYIKEIVADLKREIKSYYKNHTVKKISPTRDKDLSAT